jgi:hypothetical protein
MQRSLSAPPSLRWVGAGVKLTFVLWCCAVFLRYVPYVGDSKRAMDEYTSEIFMGGTNTIVMHNTCEVGTDRTQDPWKHTPLIAVNPLDIPPARIGCVQRRYPIFLRSYVFRLDSRESGRRRCMKAMNQ